MSNDVSLNTNNISKINTNISKINTNKNSIFNTTNIIKITGGVFIIVSIIAYFINNSQKDKSTKTNIPIINPEFGTSYGSSGGLGKLYEELDGDKKLNNGKLQASIDLSTDKKIHVNLMLILKVKKIKW